MVFQYKFCRLINCWPFFKFCRLCCFFCRYHIACCLKMLIILFFVFLSEIFEELFVFSKCKLYLHYFGCCPLQWHFIVKSSFFWKDEWVEIVCHVSCVCQKCLLSCFLFFSRWDFQRAICFFKNVNSTYITLAAARCSCISL